MFHLFECVPKTNLVTNKSIKCRHTHTISPRASSGVLCSIKLIQSQLTQFISRLVWYNQDLGSKVTLVSILCVCDPACLLELWWERLPNLGSITWHDVVESRIHSMARWTPTNTIQPQQQHTTVCSHFPPTLAPLSSIQSSSFSDKKIIRRLWMVLIYWMFCQFKFIRLNIYSNPLWKLSTIPWPVVEWNKKHIHTFYRNVMCDILYDDANKQMDHSIGWPLWAGAAAAAEYLILITFVFVFFIANRFFCGDCPHHSNVTQYHPSILYITLYIKM